MPTTQKKLSPRKLKGSIDHLKYELEMLKFTAITLSSNKEYERDLRNAIVESFVIHARALIMFLYYPHQKEDDVMACDYFDDGGWTGIIVEIPELLDSTLKRAHKEIAHITTFRIGKELVERNWETINITREIFQAFKVFFDRVSDTFMPGGYMEWFNSHYKSIEIDSVSTFGEGDISVRST